MPKLFLTPCVIAGLLFLPSCSSAEAKACEAAEQARVEFLAAGDDYFSQFKKEDLPNLYEEARVQYTNALRVVVNNPGCFTPALVADAQTSLSKIE